MFVRVVLFVSGLALVGCHEAHTSRPTSTHGDAAADDRLGSGTSFDPCSSNPSHGFDPAAANLPACCTDVGGAAHCVAASFIPGGLASTLAACSVDGSGGYCVPDKQIRSGATYQPARCTSAIGKSPGVCLSLCIAAVANNPQSHLLTQDSCDNNEVCVPCINPFSKEPTGACKLLDVMCGGGDDGGSGDDAAPPATTP
jgi:hypothetical protein